MRRDKNEQEDLHFRWAVRFGVTAAVLCPHSPVYLCFYYQTKDKKPIRHHGKLTDELKLSIYPHRIKWVSYYAIHSVKWLEPSASVNWTHSSFHEQFKVCSKWYFSKSVSKQLSYLIRWLQWLSHGAAGFLVTGVWQILKQVEVKSATASFQMSCVSVSDFVQIWAIAHKTTDSNMCLKNTGCYSTSHWITVFGNIWFVIRIRIRIRPHISTFIEM